MIISLQVGPVNGGVCVSGCYCTSCKPSGKVVCTRYEEFSTEMVRKLAPKSVVAPLFAPEFDCIDVGKRLVDAGFTGKFCVVAEPTLPNMVMVSRELRRQFSGLDLRLMSHRDAFARISPETR